MRITLAWVLLFFFYFSPAQNKNLLVNSGEAITDGIKYHEDKKYDKAINKYKLVSECDTNYARALYEMCISYMAQKSYPEAIEACKKGLKLESSYAVGFVQQLGNAYSYNKEVDKAMETYRNGLKENPYYFRFYYEMAVASYLDKKPKIALNYIDTCLKINFGFGLAHYLMGLICQDNNYFVPALMSFQMASYLSYNESTGLSSLSSIEKIATGETRVNSKDSIVQLFPKDENNFEDLEDIIRSKSELDARYKVKPEVKLPFTNVIKCLHILNSNLAKNSDAKGWYAENLLPVYKEWWNNEGFALMVYRMCVATDKPDAIKMYKKNMDEISKQYTSFFSHFLKKKLIYESRLPSYKGEFKHLFLYDNANLFAMIPSNEPYSLSKGFSPKNGYYIYFYSNGKIKKEGNYVDGNESGIWKYFDEQGNLIKIYTIETATDYVYQNFYSNGQPKERGHMKDQIVKDTVFFYYTNGVMEKSIPVDENQKINGNVYQYYDNGQLRSILVFSKDKQKDGELIVYYRDGSVKSKTNLKSEKREGDFVEYYRSGQIKQTGKYKNDNMEGIVKSYHPNGVLASEGNYVGGELDGIYKEYYDNGVLESESKYAKGENTDKTKNYDYDGKLFAEYLEVRGKIKNATYYDKKGKVIHEVDPSKNNQQFAKYNFAGIKTEDGKLLKDFRTGSWNFYYDNGALFAIKTFDNQGNIYGKVEEYFVGGGIMKKYEMTKNEKDGYYVEYYTGGAKSEEGYFVEGKKQGVWKTYYVNGVVKTESYYLNDEVTGSDKTYYLNGKLKSIEFYKDNRFYKFSSYDTSGVLISTDTLGIPYGNLNIFYKNNNKFLVNQYTHAIWDGKQISYWGNSTTNNVQERKNSEKINTELSYYPNGKLQKKAMYKYGDLDSLYQTFFENEKTEHAITFRFGESTGPEKYFYDNGKVEFMGEQKYNEREGWYEYFAPDGHLQYKISYLHGVAISYTYQDKDGKFVNEIPLTNSSGPLNTFFTNGKPSAIGTFAFGEKNGSYVKYYFNGNKSLECILYYGYNNGIATLYYENGKIKEQVNYVYGLKHGVEKAYDDKGNLIRETTWEYDYKNGPEKLYAAGKLIKTINYEYDNTFDK